MTYAYIGTRAACLRAIQLAADFYGLRSVGVPTWSRSGREWRIEQVLA